jgi:hypothetical protein
MAPPQGWTPVSPAAAPEGWTPVTEPPPDFSMTITPDQPSMEGFLGNVLSSGVEFGKNIATPLLHPIATVKGVIAAASNPTETGRAIKNALAKRYGSYDAWLNTAYTDPVGMASDLSMVFGGAAKLASLTGQVPKLASGLRAASTVLNPLEVPARAAASTGRAAYGAAINPSRRIRQGFPGAVDAGYAANVLPTEGGLAKAERILEASAAHTQDLLQRADAAGAPGVNIKRQIIPNMRDVATEANKRFKLGKPDERMDVSMRARALARRNPGDIPLAASNQMKQTAQTLADSAFRAQERGAIIKDLDALSDLKVAQAFRKAIEENAATVGVRDIGQSNAKTQSLIGLAQALEDATNQPSRLTHLMATLGGIGGGVGAGIPGGAAAYTAARVATAKPVMAASGIAVGKGGSAAMRNAQLMRALAVVRAASEQEQPDGE